MLLYRLIIPEPLIAFQNQLITTLISTETYLLRANVCQQVALGSNSSFLYDTKADCFTNQNASFFAHDLNLIPQLGGCFQGQLLAPGAMPRKGREEIKKDLLYDRKQWALWDMWSFHLCSTPA